jgi:inactivated superfamily I helicase
LVNPSGQFLFIEIDTGQPLVRALAELLVAGRAMEGTEPGQQLSVA